MPVHRLVASLVVVVIGAVALACPLAGAAEPSPGEAPIRRPCPAWFQDAKFGIWSHWGPASIPGIGNSHPAEMYQQGSKAYAWHVAHHGHPSKVGFKGVILGWKAEQFDAEALMARYQAAGARYFVALASHHDNFDNFDSTYNPWNSVRVGPRKDLVGAFAAAARKAGLRFGVSWHADQRGWDYYAGSYGADTSGPLAGVPYDGADPANAALYNPVHAAKSAPSADWLDRWTKRQIELIDRYQPDLLYYDGGINFPQQGGLQVVEHFFAANAAAHGGTNEGLINTKDDQFVRDFERGGTVTISPRPWQCDTSLGGWFFLDDPIADYHSKSKDTATVIHLLADIVSKNGNLLLNFPQKGDGSLYPKCIEVLDGLAQWMPINGEAIYGTRPWVLFGEGPTHLPEAKYMNELKQPLTAQDIRYTTKDGAVYAIVCGVPTGKVCLPALGRLGNRVTRVELLGATAPMKFRQEWEGLIIDPPATWPCAYAVTFKIALSR